MSRFHKTHVGLKFRKALLEERGASQRMLDWFSKVSTGDELEVEWSPLSAVLLSTQAPGVYDWLMGEGLLPPPDLRHCDFSGMDLTGASFRGANLSYANFRGACISEADFFQTNLYAADFSKTTGRYAEFDGSYVAQTLFDDAKLDHVSFVGAHLRLTSFANARLLLRIGGLARTAIFGVFDDGLAFPRASDREWWERRKTAEHPHDPTKKRDDR